jgi:hypothetical protein
MNNLPIYILWHRYIIQSAPVTMDRRSLGWHEVTVVTKYDILVLAKARMPRGWTIILGGVPMPLQHLPPEKNIAERRLFKSMPGRTIHVIAGAR